jgi:hypothetical protein
VLDLVKLPLACRNSTLSDLCNIRSLFKLIQRINLLPLLSAYPTARLKVGQNEEVIALAKATLETQLASGELVTIEVDQHTSPQEIDPWLKHMGIFASDPTFDDFLAEVAAYRQQVNEQEMSE